MSTSRLLCNCTGLSNRLYFSAAINVGFRKPIRIPINQNFRFLAQNVKHNSTVAVATQPPVAAKSIGWWLIACSGTVLTRSGLSMVNWHLFKEFPPLSQIEWEREFDQYKEFPEFKTRNRYMTLEEFKWIWYMEYLHRMWGRTVGAVFALPAAYFWYRGYFNKGMKIRSLVFGSLIAFQGLLGWYMVKSGLVETGSEPRVSQYRLAAHLGSAFLLYTLFLWSALGHLLPPQMMVAHPNLRRFRMFSHATKGLIFLTAISGAFVAGLEAGLVYNSFPKMADKWIPDDILEMEPKRKNFTENPTTVQFDHRILGTSVLLAVSSLWLYSRKVPISSRARMAINCMMFVALAQVSLGIATLLLYVPKELAATHQSGSLALLSTAIWLTHELKMVKHLPKV
uniref:Cytochrome c oxidase assembly protein COX15-like protein n=1 Tax=Strigamia maritima TaxID=126957 RepID=T1IZ75_STRMM